MSNLKLCKNCKKYISGDYCNKVGGTINPVNGKIKYPLESYCLYQRDWGFIGSYLYGTCGKQARFFEGVE